MYDFYTGLILKEMPPVMKECGLTESTIYNKFEPYMKTLIGMIWNITQSHKVNNNLYICIYYIILFNLI